MVNNLAKWLPFYSPLYHGRFDFTMGEAGVRRLDTWVNGTVLAGGRFWVRPQGGHHLRVSDDHVPTLKDPITGASDAGGGTITEWAALANHPFNARHLYMVTAPGGAGVEVLAPAGALEVTTNGFGGLSNPIPNAARGQSAEANADGSFTLRWFYNKQDEATPPADFVVYSDSGTGTIDFLTPIGTVTYNPGAARYSFTTAVLAGAGALQPFLFSIRARKSPGNEEKNTVVLRPLGSTSAQNTTQAGYGYNTPAISPLRQTG